jgi:hypothetical protein
MKRASISTGRLKWDENNFLKRDCSWGSGFLKVILANLHKLDVNIYEFIVHTI